MRVLRDMPGGIDGQGGSRGHNRHQTAEEKRIEHVHVATAGLPGNRGYHNAFRCRAPEPVESAGGSEWYEVAELAGSLKRGKA